MEPKTIKNIQIKLEGCYIDVAIVANYYDNSNIPAWYSLVFTIAQTCDEYGNVTFRINNICTKDLKSISDAFSTLSNSLVHISVAKAKVEEATKELIAEIKKNESK